MSSYSAIVAPLRNIGASRLTVTQTGGQWYDHTPDTVARIRRITSPHLVMDAMGGFLSADFVIPPEEAQGWMVYLRKNAYVWMFDGQTPIFYGELDAATTQNDASVLITVNGFWQVATGARMREVWDDWDMTRLVTAPVNKRSGSVSVDSDNTLTMSFPNGTVLLSGDRVCVDYFLFGEATGTRDNKKLTGFEVDITTNNNGGNFQFMVIGKSDPNSVLNDVLYTTTGTGRHRETATGNSWPQSDGYRLLRFAWDATAGTTTSADRQVTLDSIRVSTRQDMFNAMSNAAKDIAAIARDVFNQKAEALDRFDIPLDFWRQETGTGSFIYGGNGAYADGSAAADPVTGTGTCVNVGPQVTGFNIVDWTAPTDILTTLAQLSGCQVGFYFPINQRTGYFSGGPNDNPNVGGQYASQWIGAAPQLVFKQWSTPANPDYYVSLQEGAQLSPDPNEQPLLNVEYVNYQTLKGRNATVVVEDTNLGGTSSTLYTDYLTAQGYRRAEDYTLQPSVGGADGNAASTATMTADQLITLRNHPAATGTLTISKDPTSRYPITDANGNVPVKLALLRPGIYKVVDAPTSKRIASGAATQIEWWGETLDQPEMVQITLGQPGQMKWDRRIAHLQWRSDHSWFMKR